MANNYAIELLMTMRNMIAPQVAEAKAQVAELAATTEAANVSSAASAAAMSAGIVTALSVAAVAAAAFGGSLLLASSRMMDLGSKALDARAAGDALSYNQSEAASFYSTVTEAKTRLAELGDDVLAHSLPALNALAEGFNSATIAAKNLFTAIENHGAGVPSGREAMSIDAARFAPKGTSALWDQIMKEAGYEAPPPPTYGPPMPSGLFGRNFEEQWRASQRKGAGQRAPRIGALNSSGGAWGAYGPFQEQDEDALVRLMSAYRDQADKAGSAMDKLTASAGKLSPTVQAISSSVTSFAASAVVDFGHVGSAFKNMIRDVLAEIGRQQVAKGIGSLVNAFVGGLAGGGSSAGGVLGGIKEGATKTMNVHISAMSARDVLRDLTSPTGELRNAYRSIDYAGRLP